MKAIIAFFLTFVLGSLSQQNSIILDGTLYDFSNGNIPGGHPDFNTYGCGVQRGIVEQELGPDNKPVLKDKKLCLTSADTFNQWFNQVSGVNEVFPHTLVAYWDASSKAYKFQGTPFFPLDGRGYGYEGMPHNYGFCFELHTKFSYEQGQKFDFMGDDDVWVFINRKLAIDLGGVHGSASDSVSLDSLGLEQGQTYPLDFFFCERHQSESNLIFSTSIVLDPCGTTDTDGDGTPDLCDACPKGDMELSFWKEDVVGPNNAVTVHCDLGATALYPYKVDIDFGDGTGSQTYEVSGSLVQTHKYEKSGEYTITYQSGSQSGCGDGSSGSIDVTVGGKRLAPKCSDYSVVPAAPAKRKRSI
jgi:fibro-slime domain-containing protein